MPVTKPLDNEASVPEAIARVLEEAGVEFVFGILGGRTPQIYDALFDHRDLALFRQYRGCYDGVKIDREALYDRSCLR